MSKLQALNNNFAQPAEIVPTAEAGSPVRIAEAPQPSASDEKPVRKRGRRLLLGTAAIVLIAAGAYYGHDYWTVGRFHVETDDAYVKADNSSVAQKISGYIAEVLVRDN